MALIMLPLLIIAGGWVYFKLYGFKRALEDLVDSRTEGQYRLVIGSSSVSFSALSFSFRELSVQRNPNLPAKGIKGVNIPSMHVRFGSLPSMMALEKFRIKTLTVDEPEIIIDVPPRREQAARVDLTQQVVKLYPAIESLLDRFDIESLKIRRATIALNKPQDESLRLRLVDLLVKHWNIKALTGRSQLQLNIAAQALDFGKVGLSFAEIEYNFQQRHLYFSNFSFTSVDTVSGSRVEVTGKSLRLQHLDYKDLYENQRYVLRRAEIDQPHVRARFKLNKATRDKTKSGDMLTRIVKQSVGECHIDSAVIKNAKVHLIIQRDRDSVEVDLPRVDFRLHTFRVQRDSSTFSIGEVGINLNRTAISLRNNLSLHFHEILFDRHQDLTVTDAAIIDSLRHEKIATIGKVRLEYFDLLRLVLDKQFYAHRVDIENASIRLNPARIGRNKSLDLGLKDIAIRNVTLSNTDVHYADTEKSLLARGLSIAMARVGYDTLGELHYTLQTVKLQHALVNHTAQNTTTRAKDIAFDGRKLSAGQIDLLRDSLHLLIKSVAAEVAQPHKPGHYGHWKTIRCGSLEVQGSWPGQAGPAAQSIDFNPVVDVLQIDRITAAVQKDGMTVSFSGNDIFTTGIAAGHGAIQFARVQGELADVCVVTRQVQADATTVTLGYPDFIQASRVNMAGGDVNIKLKGLSAASISTRGGQWQAGKIVMAGLEAVRHQETLLQADSVRLLGLLSGGPQPSVRQVEVFHPVITPTPANTAGRPDQKRVAWPVPDRVVIHPGRLQLADGHRFDFGAVESESAKGAVQCAYLHTMLGNRPVEMKGLVLDGDQLQIDSVHIRQDDPRQEAAPVEDDHIDARLYGMQIDGISVDAGLQAKVWGDLDIGLERFAIDIHRDKRLPDPPIKEKPLTLEEFLQLPQNLQVNKIRVREGSLRYAEISDQTGEEAVVSLDHITAILEFNRATSRLTMNAKTRLFGSGVVDLKYQTLDDRSFHLNVKVRDFDLKRLNQVLVPLQSVRVKSGFLKAYDLDVIAGEDKATGKAAITYTDLHLELFKRNDPDRRGLRMELINLLADGIILRNRREAAVADVNRQRIRHKSIFNYWVKTVFHGALATVKNGKRVRKRK